MLFYIGFKLWSFQVYCNLVLNYFLPATAYDVLATKLATILEASLKLRSWSIGRMIGKL